MSWLKKLLKGRDPKRAEALISQGLAHYREGRFQEALKAYEAAAQADEENAVAHLNHGLCLLDLYNLTASEMDADTQAAHLEATRASLQAAIEKNGTLLAAYRALGHVLRRLGKHAEAAAAFQQVLDDAPADFEHRSEVAKALAEASRRANEAEALAVARALAIRNVDDEDAPEASAAEVDEALKNLAPALAAGEPTTELMWVTGVLRRKQGRLDDARAWFERLLEESPRHLEAHRELASIHMKSGDAKAALVHSRVAYEEDPSNPGLVCNVGVCHLSLGDFAQAREFLEMARGMDPKNPIIANAWAALEAEGGAPSAAG
jgi:tetratricopeptide (TPR) repeat protein